MRKNTLDRDSLRIQTETSYNRAEHGIIGPLMISTGSSQLFWNKVKKYLNIKRWQYWRDPVLEIQGKEWWVSHRPYQTGTLRKIMRDILV